MAGKILIVDDEAFIRLLIEEALEDVIISQEVEVFTAADGEEALSLIRTEIPELVFMDVMMPKMNGFDLCQKIRQEFDLGRIYIVLLTAKGQDEDRVRGEISGADQFMTKPFDPDEVLEIANRVFKTDHA